VILTLFYFIPPKFGKNLDNLESDWLDNQESESTWQKECTPLCNCVSNNVKRGKQKESLSMCIQRNVINTQVHKISPPHSVNRVESPDLKIVSCMDSLLTYTPAQSAPDRLLLASDVKLQQMTA
jgi:hypothetical protein